MSGARNAASGRRSTGREPGAGVAGFDPGESPLSRLAQPRGKVPAFLTEAEVAAGERLRADYTRGQLLPGIGQRWDGLPRQGRSGTSGGGDLSDSAIDARARVNAAIEAVGPELSGVLIDVCCFLKGLETVEKERQWPVRSGKLMLKTGLSVLARHFGFYGAAASGLSGIRRWGTADYRPTIGGEKTPAEAGG